MKGLIFSIEEFALFDGPGIRTCIFFKGCPLACAWCHNPEGLSPLQQIVRNPNGCLHCGRCRQACPSPGRCLVCGKCVLSCPRDLIRVSGTVWEAADLACRVLKNADILTGSGGGVTLSGGEVLMQGEFLLELLHHLQPLHRAIETSGFGPPEIFARVLENTELVYFDLKHMDSDAHKRWTKQPNDLILRNAAQLKAGDTPFLVRIPLIRGVNDTEENLAATAAFLEGARSLAGVELLPYNTMAGAKYAMLGLSYGQTFEPPEPRRMEEAVALFASRNIPARIR